MSKEQSAIQFLNLDSANSFRALQRSTPYDVRKVDETRVGSCSVPVTEDLTYNYAASPVDAVVVATLQELVDEQQLLDKYRLLISGEVMNTGEKRMVLHHLLRGQLGEAVVHEGKDLGAFYRNQVDRFSDFARRVHAGEVKGSTGKCFTTVVQIGIGGSDLGPRALYLALRELSATDGTPGAPDAPAPGTTAPAATGAPAAGGRRRMEAHFISNVDPDDAAAVISRIDPEETLFILVSKSGTTQETLTNERFVARLAADRVARAGAKDAAFDISRHMVAVTSQTSPLATSSGYLDAFYIDDFIGGRYSATSAVGGVILSLAFGPEVFEEILAGAHEADKAALEPAITRNAALLDAMVGLYERNVLGYQQTAVLPYSQALHRFPAHLQQLDMESNGKRVNRAGETLAYETGPVVFGEPGTNGQHSFYQLLHQGTTVVPLQFIGFRSSQREEDVESDGSTSQVKLNANLAAQIVAFAAGKKDVNPNKDFPGGRPSTLLHGDRLTARALGALLAFYENKVMFQGFAWNINSFDQEGVQLGKVLTKQVLAGGTTGALAEYARLLGV